MNTSALPRKQKIPAEKPEQPKEPQLPNLEDRKVPTFDKKDVTVVFVLGKLSDGWSGFLGSAFAFFTYLTTYLSRRSWCW
jgi:hypothetical protein